MVDRASRSSLIKVTSVKPEEPTPQLSMVHFTDLARRRDVNHGRYQYIYDKKFINPSDVYKRGGQRCSVYFYAPPSTPKV